MALTIVDRFNTNSQRELSESDNVSRIIATPSAAARQNFFYIQEAGEIRASSNFSAERHGLNSYLISYTLSGTGYLNYDDKQYVLRRDQAFLIDCNQYHAYRTDSTDLWSMVCIHFYGATSTGYYNEFAKINGSPIITLTPDSLVPKSIRKIANLHRDSAQCAELYTSLSILDVLTELMVGAHKSLPDYSNPNEIAMIIEFLSSHYNEKVKLDDLASQFSLNKYHLHRAFKQITGCTPNEYLIRIRITRAKELLCETDTSVREVAEIVGVDNTSHFINLFKAHEGMTPSSFRKLWKSSRS